MPPFAFVRIGGIFYSRKTRIKFIRVRGTLRISAEMQPAPGRFYLPK